MKRAFFKMKDVQVGEELIVKENYGKLILTEFYIKLFVCDNYLIYLHST